MTTHRDVASAEWGRALAFAQAAEAAARCGHRLLDSPLVCVRAPHDDAGHRYDSSDGSSVPDKHQGAS